MNSKVAVIFLAIVGLTIADPVLDLTDDDFSSRISEIDAALVMFSDVQCYYCNELALEFDKVSELLQGTTQPFTLARVNCDEGGKETCLKYEVVVYEFPVMKIFRRGQLGQDYDGPDDAAGIAKYMKRRYGAASTELFTLAEVEEFLKSQELTIIATFEKGSDLGTFFLTYADDFKDDYRFGHSSAAEVLAKYTNSIQMFRPPHFHNKFEPNSVTFKGDSHEEFTSFLTNNRHGLVGHRTTENVQDFEHPNVIVYYSVDYVNNVKKTNYWRNRIFPAALENRDYKFAISSTKEFQLELETFGRDYYGEKPIVTAYDKDGRKFKMNAEFSIENVKQFVADLKDGKLKPFKKSTVAPIPNDGPVKIAVATNFDEIVTNNGKDTFLEIFAPWCGYCKELAPVIDELGAKMVDEDVEIVKFDGTNNDVPPGFHLQGYPSLFWLPKDSKDKPLLYSEGRDLESFIEYIAKHATSELKNYDRSGEIKKNEL